MTTVTELESAFIPSITWGKDAKWKEMGLAQNNDYPGYNVGVWADSPLEGNVPNRWVSLGCFGNVIVFLSSYDGMVPRVGFMHDPSVVSRRLTPKLLAKFFEGRPAEEVIKWWHGLCETMMGIQITTESLSWEEEKKSWSYNSTTGEEEIVKSKITRGGEYAFIDTKGVNYKAVLCRLTLIDYIIRCPRVPYLMSILMAEGVSDNLWHLFQMAHWSPLTVLPYYQRTAPPDDSPIWQQLLCLSVLPTLNSGHMFGSDYSGVFPITRNSYQESEDAVSEALAKLNKGAYDEEFRPLNVEFFGLTSEQGRMLESLMAPPPTWTIQQFVDYCKLKAAELEEGTLEMIDTAEPVKALETV